MLIQTKAELQISSLTLREPVISAILVANMPCQTDMYDRESLDTVIALKVAFFFVGFSMPKHKSNYSLVTKESTKNRFWYPMFFNVSSCCGFALISKKNIAEYYSFVYFCKTSIRQIYLQYNIFNLIFPLESRQ